MATLGHRIVSLLLEVSAFQRFVIERFHCIVNYTLVIHVHTYIRRYIYYYSTCPMLVALLAYVHEIIILMTELTCNVIIAN